MKKLVLGLLIITTIASASHKNAFAKEPVYETPNVEISDYEVPNYVVPNFEIPNIEIPNFEIPDFEVPNIEIPNIEIPNIEIPNIEIPNIEIPNIEIPNIEIPNIEIPIVIPEIEIQNGTMVDSNILNSAPELFNYGVENAQNNAEQYNGYSGIYDFRTVEIYSVNDYKKDAKYTMPITGDFINIDYDEETGITEVYVESKRNNNPSMITKSYPDNKVEATIIADGDICLGTYGNNKWGIIVGDENSSINIEMKNSSKVAYTVNEDSKAQNVSISIDKSSQWYVTGTSYINELIMEDNNLSNIVDYGNTIYYDKTSEKNNWLEGKTIQLNGGGKLVPFANK